MKYDDDNNIVVIEDNIKTVYNSDGSIKEEVKISTESDITPKTEHIENLKIYDEENEFINEDWYIELDDKYEDKQLLQAIVILNK